MSYGKCSTTRVFADANAVIDYMRESALHDLGRPPTGRRAEALRVRLGQMRHVFVAKTAAKEARRNMKKDITQKLGHSGTDRVLNLALLLLRKYRIKTECEDEVEYVPAVKKMYAMISSDPSNQKFIEWEKKKGVFKNNPVLGSDINDLKILSTVVHYVQFYTVEFWTHDMDFTMFADVILRTFGLKVVDSYRLGDQFL